MSVIYRRILGKVGVGFLCIVLLSLACNPLDILTSSTAVEDNERGVDNEEQGQTDSAIDEFDEANALNPQDAYAYLSRGLAYYDKGDYVRAIADFDEAIALDPQDALAYANRGYAYHNVGDDDKAIADYERALELGLELSDHEAVEELLKELGQ